MDTSLLKRFAIEARKSLKTGVASKLLSLGFDDRGELIIDEPQQIQGGVIFKGEIIEDASFYEKWIRLKERLAEKSSDGTPAITEVLEEGAYTWFNRLMAIRIMYKNGFEQPQLEYESESLRVPKIVMRARRGEIPEMDETEKRSLVACIGSDRMLYEQFSILILAFCRHNSILQACFGHIADYTELLLPANILEENGFVNILNTSVRISDEDYRTPELIGWLYQFYISEKKDDVFAGFSKGKKAEAEDIPAATQIFTPNWIVKYMVQNTLGRIYLDNNPGSDLAQKWEYLVPQEERSESYLKYFDLSELKCADLACGSGHILNEIFDILMQAYLEDGYTKRQAVENIFKNNLTGIDIDTRAKQLATFSLMMKACREDKSFLDCHCLPKILDIPKVNRYSYLELDGHFCAAYRDELKDVSRCKGKELEDAFTLMEDADTLGSIMKFDISEGTRKFMLRAVEVYEREPFHKDTFAPLIYGFKLILALTESYHAIVMNPPYMGSGNMNSVLSNYVKGKYPEGKADLFSVFMILAEERLTEGGLYGMINMQSWMFLSSFESLRCHVLQDTVVENMLHLGPRTFDELSGEVVQNTAFVIRNTKPSEATSGTYYRLVDGKNCGDKERMYLAGNGKYSNIPQDNFKKIPGSPIGYWVSEKILSAFLPENLISSKSIARSGFSTGDNERFTRYWFELNLNSIGFNLNNNNEFLDSDYDYVPYSAGGGFRKWYGNLDRVVDWTHPEEMHRPRTTYMDLYYKPAITWNAITSGKLSCRYYDKGYLFEHAAATLFVNEGEDNRIFLAYLNSNVFQEILKILNPTLNNGGDVVSSVPIIAPKYNISTLVEENISISRLDWDAHETSWDFKQNELLGIDEDSFIAIANDYANETGICIDLAPAQPESLKWRVDMYKMKWEAKFYHLHRNEEELNRQFIDIYGLQDELALDVPLGEITILQQGEISVDSDEIVWHDDVLMKQLLSYAVGCFMGRYRLDKPGLNIAHPEPSAEELASYSYNGKNFIIDEDGIIPLMGDDCGFDDNVITRIKEFVGIVFDADEVNTNLSHIEASLGKTIENYFIKDFWKDHKKMYQNRPIYWLFSSKTGAFQVLVYMHRITPFTVATIRNKYLIPYIGRMRAEFNSLNEKAALLATPQRKRMEKLRKDLEECVAYDELVHKVADAQIGIDLDDGVIKNHSLFASIATKIK